MRVEKGYRDLSANTGGIAVSKSAKRQIAAKVLESRMSLSGTKIGPSFMDGFPEGFPDIAVS
jgi:hypothetical protein